MTAQEFRISNLFQDEEGVFPITKQFFQLLEVNLKTTKPILLTEEWLDKFDGVEKNNVDKNFHRFKDRLFVNREGIFYDYGTGTPLKHVHTFQNFIFAVMQEELTLK